MELHKKRLSTSSLVGTWPHRNSNNNHENPINQFENLLHPEDRSSHSRSSPHHRRSPLHHRKSPPKNTPAHFQYLQNYHRNNAKFEVQSSSQTNSKKRMHLIEKNQQAFYEALLTQNLLNHSVSPQPTSRSPSGTKRSHAEAISEHEFPDFCFGSELRQRLSDPVLPKVAEKKKCKDQLKNDCLPMSYIEKCARYLLANAHEQNQSVKSELKEMHLHDPFPPQANDGTGSLANNRRDFDSPSVHLQSDAPLDLCTSPKNSNPNSPNRLPPEQQQISLELDPQKCSDNKAIEKEECKCKSPELRLIEHPKEEASVTTEIGGKIAQRRLTGRKSLDRKPCPIDLSCSTRTDNEIDGYPSSLLAQFPGLRATAQANDGRSLNTPDLVVRKTPSDTTTTFFPNSTAMTPSMVRVATLAVERSQCF